MDGRKYGRTPSAKGRDVYPFPGIARGRPAVTKGSRKRGESKYAFKRCRLTDGISTVDFCQFLDGIFVGIQKFLVAGKKARILAAVLGYMRYDEWPYPVTQIRKMGRSFVPLSSPPPIYGGFAYLVFPRWLLGGNARPPWNPARRPAERFGTPK